MKLYRLILITPLLAMLSGCPSNETVNAVNNTSINGIQVMPGGGTSGSCDAPSLSDAYSVFNLVRQQAGLIAMSSNSNLELAAQNHATYLQLNNQAGHGEQAGLSGFTGVSPSERAVAVGYVSSNVNEGLVTYSATISSSVDSLMSAIYHRFGILDFERDELGLGFTEQDNSCLYNFVHNGGNSYQNALCTSSSYVSGTYYYNVCADANLKVGFDDYQQAMNTVYSQNPRFITWPYAEMGDFYPAFLGNENPNPVPDYTQTGNPLSIQFNPFYFSDQLKLVSFKLFDSNGNEVGNTRLLSSSTDPNGKFSAYQFALFPLDLLAAQAHYSAEVVFEDQGVQESVSWGFATSAM